MSNIISQLIHFARSDVRATVADNYGFFLRALIDRDGNQCLKCGAVEGLQIDHVIPVAQLGPSELWNLQLLCAGCNGEKGNRTRDYRTKTTVMPTLRPYQIESLQAIYTAYERDIVRQLLVLPTGTGKTVTFSALVEQFLGSGKRALVLAHRDRLIQQAADKISKQIPMQKIGIVKAEMNRKHAPCVVASIQTLARQARLRQMPQFDLVIIDEAHRSLAKSYQRIIDHVCHEKTLLLGVTATPDRADGKGLEKVYQEIVYEMSLLDAIEQGFLVDLRAVQVRIDADFSKVHTKTDTEGISEFKQDEVVELMDAGNWFVKVTEAWLEHAQDRQTIAFVPPGKDQAKRPAAMAYKLADHMRSLGIRAAALDGTAHLSAQRATMKQFEAGQLQVLVNVDLFTEGVDVPSIDCVLMASPTKSRGRYCQRVGRGTRLFPGKSDCLILDMVGLTDRLDLCTASSLIGLKNVRKGESLREAKKREDAEAEQLALCEEPVLDIEGKLVAQDVDLWHGARPAVPVRKPFEFSWSLNFSGQRTLHIKNTTVIVRPMADENWLATDKKDFRAICGSAEECQKAAEAFAKTLFFGDQSAPWRERPASDKQIGLMTKLRIRFAPGISAGEASRLIDARFKKVREAA